MIPFERVQLAHRAQLHQILYEAAGCGCEYSFDNVYLWGEQQFALLDGVLVVFSQFGSRCRYAFPVGPGDRKAAVEQLAEDAARRGIPFCMYGLTCQDVQALHQWFPGRFTCRPTPGNFDYLYHIDTLCSLKGKHLQAKRNHINRFLHTYAQHTFAPLTQQNLDDCRELAAQWFASQGAGDFFLEQQALARCFDAYGDLGMEGLVLYAGGRAVAFTIGNRIRPDVFDVNFEKAFSEVPGAYAMINRGFARYIQSLYPAVRYFNREDDMDLPGLRRAKQSYQPAFLLEKFSATPVQEESPCRK